MRQPRLRLLLAAGCCCLGGAVKKLSPAAELSGAEALRAAVEDLRATFGDRYPGLRCLARLDQLRSDMERHAELTAIPLDQPLRGAELSGSQVNFSRPELSSCLAKLTDHAEPAYQEALAIIRAGKEKLAKKPRADMPGFRLTSGQDINRQARLDALAEIEIKMRDAILRGGKRVEKQNTILSGNLTP